MTAFDDYSDKSFDFFSIPSSYSVKDSFIQKLREDAIGHKDGFSFKMFTSSLLEIPVGLAKVVSGAALAALGLVGMVFSFLPSLISENGKKVLGVSFGATAAGLTNFVSGLDDTIHGITNIISGGHGLSFLQQLLE